MGDTRPCPSCDTSLPLDAAFCPSCGAATSSLLLADTLLGASRGTGGGGGSWELQPERLQAALGVQYELGRLIGRGGYAEVFAVRDLRLKRELAAKVLRPDLILTDALVERFRREAEAVAALEHPNIVPIYDVGEAGGICWLFMPLVRGETLRSVLARERQLPWAETRRILLEVAGALQAAHDAGVVHRDIKPENLLIEGKTGRVLLMDFGIAKAMDTSGEATLTGTGVVIGTPQYMSPEQATGARAIDARSDQYSLGVVAYQMLAGGVPFEGENAREVMARQMLEEPMPLSAMVPEAPAQLTTAIHRALRKDPRLRFESMADFASALRGEAVAAPDDGGVRREKASRFRIPVRRRGWALLLWLAVASGGVWAAGRYGLLEGLARGASTPAGPIDRRAPTPPPLEPRSTGASTPAGARRSPPRSEPTIAESGRPAGAAASCAEAAGGGDWTAALSHCRTEADSGETVYIRRAAQRTLGILHAEGRFGDRPGDPEALASFWLRQAAENDDTTALMLMAPRYDAGRGIARDPQIATRLYHQAANLGVTRAYPVVAQRYAEGLGIERNLAAAAEWYRRADSTGHVPSITRLAELYARGRGIKRNDAEASRLYARAANAGEPEAMYQLGMILITGRGSVRKNEADGLGWIRRAAAVGHAGAKAELTKRGG